MEVAESPSGDGAPEMSDEVVEAGEQKAKSTVFVRNLPYNVTKEALEELFGEIGPVKNVSIILDKDKQSRGFGFVKFGLAEDAVEAAAKLDKHKLEGRPIKVELALKKGELPVDLKDKAKRKKDKPHKPDESTETDTTPEQENAPLKLKVATAPTPKANPVRHTLAHKTIVLRGFGPDVTDKHLRIRARKIGPVSSVEIVGEDCVTKERFARVEYESTEAASEAIVKLNDHIFKGRKIQALSLANVRQNRLIVRNIPFKITANELRKDFEPYGLLNDVNVPEKQPGQNRGFAFVEFYLQSASAAAMSSKNGQKLRGRPIAVDWAVSASSFQRLSLQQEGEGNNPSETTTATSQALEEGEAKSQAQEDQNLDMSKKFSDETEREEDQPEEDASESGDTSEEDNDEGKSSSGAEDEVSTKGESDEEPEEDEEGPGAGPSNEGKAAMSKPKVSQPPPEEELRRTVFVRNILFETSEDALKKCFEQFGRVKYVKMVQNKDNGLPKGNAFVLFRDEDSAKRAIKAGEASLEKLGNLGKKKKQVENSAALAMAAGGVTLDGRVLVISPAVDRTQATTLSDEKKKQKTDKRNLYLGSEGYVNTNFEKEEKPTLPQGDIEKRRRAQKEKKEKLRNPLFFISPTRLSVRNLDKDTDDRSLQNLFRSAAQKGMEKKLVSFDEPAPHLRMKELSSGRYPPVKIVTAKVTRDAEEKDSKGRQKSKGFGFVEFTEHVHALAALRELNNNPAYSENATGGRAALKQRAPVDARPRLIVEFSVENLKKLRIQEARRKDREKKKVEEAKAKHLLVDESEKPVKKSRGKRQRERKKQAAEAAEGKDVKRRKLDHSANTSKETSEAKNTTGKLASLKSQKGEQVPVGPRKRHRQMPEEENLLQAQTIEEDRKRSRKEPKKRVAEKREAKQERDFDKLVDTYKSKLFGSAKAENLKRSRWFDEE